MKRNKGITLIALVVTVVVLLILAAISIGALMGENGTITKTQEAKKEHEIGEEREIVNLSALQAASEEEYGIITEDKLRKALEENIGGREFKLDVEETQFVITFNDSGRKYYVPKEMQIPTDNDIKFTYDPSEWTTQDVTVTVETTLEGYTIETSKNGTEWNATNKLVYSENGKVYVKLIKESGEACEEVFEGEVTNIDKTKPVITEATGTENSINLTATDDISGIVGYTATTSGLAPNNFTSCSGTKVLKVTIPNIQENTIYYVWVKDAAGNISLAKTVQTTHVDRTPPIITETIATTNSIKIVATDDESGIIGYAATTDNTTPSNFISCENTKTLNATLENLTQNTTYYVWVKDQAGNVSVAKTAKTQKVPDLTTENVTFTNSPSTWTNGNVVATAKVTVGEYKLQTSKDNKTWTTTNNQTFTSNGTIYARLIDSTNQTGGVVTGNVTKIDKTKPIVTSATTTTNSIKITATDEASGIIGYTVTTNNTIPSSFTSCANTKTLNVTVGNKKQNATYYIWVKDEAGNISVSKQTQTGTVPTPTVTFTYNPNTWTNGNVTATASTTASGYTIETSTDNKAWTATNKQTRSNNGAVYVRLKDSTGQVGGVATGNVTNIDKNAPSATIALSGAGTVTSNPTIYATVNHTDDASGVKTRKYVLNTNGGAIGTDEASYTGTSNGDTQSVEFPLSADGSYYVHVLTIDNAGNKNETISQAITLQQNSHKHTGNSSSGGGCYTQEIVHTHTNACYTVQYCGGYIGGEGITHCGTCDDVYYPPHGNYCTRVVGKRLTCTTPEKMYEINCGKTEGVTIDSYTISY